VRPDMERLFEIHAELDEVALGKDIVLDAVISGVKQVPAGSEDSLNDPPILAIALLAE
jgi:hypothetical protein